MPFFMQLKLPTPLPQVMIVMSMSRTIKIRNMMIMKTSDDNSVAHVELDDANENAADTD